MKKRNCKTTCLQKRMWQDIFSIHGVICFHTKYDNMDMQFTSSLQYRYRLCSTDIDCVVQISIVQYTNRLCSTDIDCVIQISVVQYRYRLSSAQIDCVVQISIVWYRSRLCSTDIDWAIPPHQENQPCNAGPRQIKKCNCKTTSLQKRM